jgi:hypothetical protein
LNVIQRLVPFVDKTIDFQADSLMLELIVDWEDSSSKFLPVCWWNPSCLRIFSKALFRILVVRSSPLTSGQIFFLPSVSCSSSPLLSFCLRWPDRPLVTCWLARSTLFSRIVLAPSCTRWTICDCWIAIRLHSSSLIFHTPYHKLGVGRQCNPFWLNKLAEFRLIVIPPNRPSCWYFSTAAEWC